ncbi:response regulator transcription factor [Paraherbaspirillum soli]|uniref:Response regulator transcription factor n=1 Tax=Paraherbaspirillum soli TaxID=631222 RepID=A0ABW0MCD7_9BURK
MIVAILEDVPAQANMVANLLKRGGYDTVIRADGDSFIELVRAQPVDVLLLDWDVPGMPGIEVLKWVRQTLFNTLPVIMVTHHDSEKDIVHALDSGADDYLTKPVREHELLARVNAQVRKYYPENEKSEVVTVGKFTLNTESRTVQVEGKDISLPLREFELALLLFNNAGRILTKDFLSKHIWGVIDRKYDASLATYVSNLRSTLGLRSKNGLVISTVYNYGYRLERV